ncbi:hypothetical protein [Nocardioides sp. T2.26MG-1]|uniref:hypothetical protein n=1 Tax=Nocardioides sp. T2.26MG-1 TaxID=3041166 RepID=UPI0024778EDA|nr:hypothetical protein [Nocardioides sp. T2.26MG-1]CAI9417429.1 hypothetical protein HIDPHFAB_03017 [Nocardioides sp. T2.26MG-1]
MRHRLRRVIHLLVATYNVGSRSDAHVLDDLRRLADLGVRVFLLQEVADRHHMLARFAEAAGFQLHQGDSNDQGHVAVLVHDDYPIKSAGYWRCTDRTEVGDWGAGPRVLAAKWIAWVEIEVAGRVLWFGSTHFPPSVQRKKATPGRARRRALFARQVVAVRAWWTTRRGGKVLGTDDNATTAFPLLRALRVIGRAGRRGARVVLRTAASHGHRPIDKIRVAWRRWLKVSPAQALDGYSSDHRPVVVDLEIKETR